jgi:hypothetical protein
LGYFIRWAEDRGLAKVPDVPVGRGHASVAKLSLNDVQRRPFAG